MASDGLTLARQLGQQGRIPEALAAVESVLRSDASNVEALILVSDLYGKLGKHQTSVQAAARAVQINPANMEAVVNLAAAYHRLGDLDKCDRCLDMVVAREPSGLRAGFFQLIKITGDVEENSLVGRVVLAFDRVAEKADVSPLVTYNMGRLLLALGALDAACQAYERVLDQDPEMAEAFASRGEIEFLQGRFDHCLEWFDEARRCRWTETSTDSLFDSKGMVQKIASGDMTLSQVDRYAARALVRLGRLVEANGMIQSAIEWQPWDIDGVRRDIVGEYIAMGQAAQTQQGIEAAIKIWESAQEIAQQANVHRLFLQLGQAYVQMAMQARDRKDRQKMAAWLERVRTIIETPPVAIPPEAISAWNELRAAAKHVTAKS